MTDSLGELWFLSGNKMASLWSINIIWLLDVKCPQLDELEAELLIGKASLTTCHQSLCD